MGRGRVFVPCGNAGTEARCAGRPTATGPVHAAAAQARVQARLPGIDRLTSLPLAGMSIPSPTVAATRAALSRRSLAQIVIKGTPGVGSCDPYACTAWDGWKARSGGLWGLRIGGARLHRRGAALAQAALESGSKQPAPQAVRRTHRVPHRACRRGLTRWHREVCAFMRIRSEDTRPGGCPLFPAI